MVVDGKQRSGHSTAASAHVLSAFEDGLVAVDGTLDPCLWQIDTEGGVGCRVRHFHKAIAGKASRNRRILCIGCINKNVIVITNRNISHGTLTLHLNNWIECVPRTLTQGVGYPHGSIASLQTCGSHKEVVSVLVVDDAFVAGQIVISRRQRVVHEPSTLLERLQSLVVVKVVVVEEVTHDALANQ